jgi:cytochrome P450
MIDELLTVFFAGSQTSASVTQNLILRLCKNPKYKAAILEEIKIRDSERN